MQEISCGALNLRDIYIVLSFEGGIRLLTKRANWTKYIVYKG